jgi:aminoglycoside phosphotransferase (APT) family kinase protein
VKDRRSFDRMHVPTRTGAAVFPSFVTPQGKPRWWHRAWGRLRSVAFGGSEGTEPDGTTPGKGPSAAVSGPQLETSALFDLLPARVASETGTPAGLLQVDKVSIAPGRAATCILSDGDRPRFVVKIPLSGRSLGRCEENLSVLAQVQSCPRIPVELRSRIPRPVGRLDVSGQTVFVETAVPGVPETSRDSPRRESTRRQALEFLTSLHVAAREDVLMEETLFEERVGHYCDRLAESLRAPAQRAVLAKTKDRLRAGLVGKHWPLVAEHGDFHLGNCLFDEKGGLCGVIDWDLGACPGMPVLDVLHLLVTTEGKGQLDGQTAATLLRERLPAGAGDVLRAYASALGIEAASLSAWTLVYVLVKLLVPAITREGESRRKWVRAVVEPTLNEIQGID